MGIRTARTDGGWKLGALRGIPTNTHTLRTDTLLHSVHFILQLRAASRCAGHSVPMKSLTFPANSFE